jgi:hypothetical protein
VYVNLRKNLFLATKKATGWRATKAGRSTRTSDKPKTSCQRLREEAGFLRDADKHRLQVPYAQTYPADLTGTSTVSSKPSSSPPRTRPSL